jgi:murein DD-endopeptidase MepM/ murein hydrolase activator NlpD
MNIIIVPAGRGQNTSLSHRHVLAALALLLLLATLVGVAAYKINALLYGGGYGAGAETLRAHERQLAQQRQEIENAKRNAELHLNALAQRLGTMQAQMLRLNALGQRLTHMAGLDKKEFNFSEEPARGGPVNAALLANASVPDFLKSLEQLSGQIEKKSSHLSVLEDVMLEREQRAAASPTGWPVQGGWVSSGFGMRADPFTGQTSYHDGVDIASGMGAPIKALSRGVITYVGQKQGRDGYGLVVEINHSNGFTTRYAHLRQVLVKVGERVEKGQAVALVGSSGRSTGPHLHFEVLRDGRTVNPRPFLRTPQG